MTLNPAKIAALRFLQGLPKHGSKVVGMLKIAKPALTEIEKLKQDYETFEQA